METHESIKRLQAAVEVFQDLNTCRQKLAGNELTYALFEELNGSNRALENLLGRDIESDFSDIGENAKLKSEIFEALINEEVEAGKEMKAALECCCTDIISVCSNYDAYADENLQLRQKLAEKLKGIKRESKEHFAKTRLDFECFAYAHVLEFIELMNDVTKFLGTETCNLSKLEKLSTKQGSDMTSEEVEFLDTLDKVFDSDVRKPGWRKIDVLWGDRRTNARIEALGFDPKNLIDVMGQLTKAEGAFFKTVRNLREVLCHETATTDEIAVKNTRFYHTVDCLVWFVRDVGNLDTELSKQFALMCKVIDVVEQQTPDKVEPVKDPDAPTDDDQQQDDNTPEPQA